MKLKLEEYYKYKLKNRKFDDVLYFKFITLFIDYLLINNIYVNINDECQIIDIPNNQKERFLKLFFDYNVEDINNQDEIDDCLEIIKMFIYY